MQIAVHNAVVSVEWSALRGYQRKETSEPQPAQLFFFSKFKLPGAVKNCVFAASSDSLKISFEKLERRRWPSPIDTTFTDAISSAKPADADSHLDRFGAASQREARQVLPKPRQKQHGAQQPAASHLSPLSLSQDRSSQDASAPCSASQGFDDKNARIAAILNAKGARAQLDSVSPARPAAAAASPAKQVPASNVAPQQHPAAAAAESSALAELQKSFSELSGRLQQQAVQITHLDAAASAATASAAAAQAESRESLAKLAAAVSDLEKCRMELKAARAQTSAQQRKLDLASSCAGQQAQALARSEATVLELEKQLKDSASVASLLQIELDAIRAQNAALTLEFRAAQTSLLRYSKPKADACVGYDAIPPEGDGMGCFSLTDCITESQLLLSMAEQSVVTMRHRNQLLLDRFYQHEAFRLHRILKSSSKRRVSFKSQLDIGEFRVNDAPDTVSSARKSVYDSKSDVADKSQKRRRKCEGQTKWMHAEAQALCYSSHAMCISFQPATCCPMSVLSCKGKVISSSDLQKWFAVAYSCIKFELHDSVTSPPLVPLPHHSHSLLNNYACEGLKSVDAALGGLSHVSLCQLFFALRGCSTLVTIDVSFNHFTELVAAALGSLLATACIAQIRLSSCDITTKCISRMPFAVPWLTEIDLSNNDIRDDGFVSLTLCLQVETCSLKKINCANNSLSSLSCRTLCTALELNSSLLSLNLDDNVSFLSAQLTERH